MHCIGLTGLKTVAYERVASCRDMPSVVNEDINSHIELVLEMPGSALEQNADSDLEPSSLIPHLHLEPRVHRSSEPLLCALSEAFGTSEESETAFFPRETFVSSASTPGARNAASNTAGHQGQEPPGDWGKSRRTKWPALRFLA